MWVNRHLWDIYYSHASENMQATHYKCTSPYQKPKFSLNSVSVTSSISGNDIPCDSIVGSDTSVFLEYVIITFALLLL